MVDGNAPIPQVPLSGTQKAWLQQAYEKSKKGAKAETAQLRRELGRSIPADFDPATIDGRLMRRGNQITLLGVLHLDPESQYPAVCDTVIRTTQRMLDSDPNRTRVTAAEICAATDGRVTEDGVKRVWQMLETVGSFHDGHDGTYDWVEIRQDSTIQEYLRYDGFAGAMNRAYDVETPRERLPSRASRPRLPAAQRPDVTAEDLAPMWKLVHPSVEVVAGKLFAEGNLSQSVLDAFKLVNNRVREAHRAKRGPHDLDGKKLMELALSATKDQASIVLDDTDTLSGKNTQIGYQMMLGGAMMGIRNPKAHEFVRLTPARAMQFLLLAGLFMDRLDEAGVAETKGE